MTFAQLCQSLGRPTVYVRGIQSRFELALPKDGVYTKAYAAFLGGIIYLRLLSLTEEELRELWHMERKLLLLLHADSSGSDTWYDAAGQTGNRDQRLLLSNHDIGVHLPSRELQLGLNFGERLQELWSGQEIG